MVFYILHKSQKNIFKLIEKKWSTEMIKSFVFVSLFHNIIHGKYGRDIENTKIITKFRDEKKLLRFLAAFISICAGQTYPIFDLFSKYKNIVLPDNIINIRQLPFVNFVDELHGTVIYFLKKKFYDYLLAEYILEAIIEKKFINYQYVLILSKLYNFYQG